MILLVLCLLAGKEDVVGCMSGTRGKLCFRIFATSTAGASMALYVYLRQYQLFLHTFIAFVLAEITLDLQARPQKARTRGALGVASSSMMTGFAVWLAEQKLCSVEPRVWVLHVVWHVLSCIGACAAIVHNAHLRAEKMLVSRAAPASCARSYDDISAGHL